VVLVSNALKTSREAAEIRKALSSQPAFTGISGQIDMDSDGAVRSIQEKLFVYRSGKLVPEEG
jgi:ABC-type branched-subunit amino acid transport system substrate-binding protein